MPSTQRTTKKTIYKPKESTWFLYFLRRRHIKTIFRCLIFPPTSKYKDHGRTQNKLATKNANIFLLQSLLQTKNTHAHTMRNMHETQHSMTKELCGVTHTTKRQTTQFEKGEQKKSANILQRGSPFFLASQQSQTGNYTCRKSVNNEKKQNIHVRVYFVVFFMVPLGEVWNCLSHLVILQ